jgi:hypothetical protein
MIYMKILKKGGGGGNEIFRPEIMYTVLGTLSVDFLPLKSMCLKRQNATNGIHQMTFLKEPNRQHMKPSIIKHELI